MFSRLSNSHHLRRTHQRDSEHFSVRLNASRNLFRDPGRLMQPDVRVVLSKVHPLLTLFP